MNLHIITGGSRGLGQALISKLLNKGDHVAEISRNGKFNTAEAKSFVCDFANDKNKEKILEQVFKTFDPNQYEMISLVNNAGMVEPVVYLQQLSQDQIAKSIMVNLIAPMALTAAFLKMLTPYINKKVIVNVSSGVARHPKETWAVYSAAKAGLECLSTVAAIENEGKNVTVINYEPGIIDTEMQAVIRSVPSERFPDLKRFVDFKKEGALASPEHVADHLMRCIFKAGLPAKNFISIQDKI